MRIESSARYGSGGAGGKLLKRAAIDFNPNVPTGRGWCLCKDLTDESVLGGK